MAQDSTQIGKNNDTKGPELELEATRTCQSTVDAPISMLPYRQRMRLITKTDEGLWQFVWVPFYIFCKFPAVAYTALMYAFGLAWISIIGVTISSLPLSSV